MRLEKLAYPGCGAPLSEDFAPNQTINCNTLNVAELLDERHKGLRQVAQAAIENIGGPAAEAALNKRKSNKLLSWLTGK